MKRIVYILAVVITIATVFGSITVFADSGEDNLTRGAMYTETETVEVNEIAGENKISEVDGITGKSETSVVDEITGEVATGNDPTKTDTPTRGDTTQSETENSENDDIVTNSFEMVFETVKKYATEIFCALSFIGSLILAYAYKSGLLPILKSGIGAISEVVSRIKDTTERGETKTDALTNTVAERLNNTESCLDNIGNAIESLGERLDLLSEDKDERQKLRVILSAQIDMLYSIFMTSALPQYQKEEVGAKISEMREALIGDENK